jgi:Flp pilus assembly secretin CpaC
LMFASTVWGVVFPAGPASTQSVWKEHPVLGPGDLPILGLLFRVRHQTMQSTNLYIIVVPRILTNGSAAPSGLPLR